MRRSRCTCEQVCRLSEAMQKQALPAAHSLTTACSQGKTNAKVAEASRRTKRRLHLNSFEEVHSCAARAGLAASWTLAGADPGAADHPDRGCISLRPDSLSGGRWRPGAREAGAGEPTLEGFWAKYSGFSALHRASCTGATAACMLSGHTWCVADHAQPHTGNVPHAMCTRSCQLPPSAV